jgi:hypothetical protein
MRAATSFPGLIHKVIHRSCEILPNDRITDRCRIPAGKGASPASQRTNRPVRRAAGGVQWRGIVLVPAHDVVEETSSPPAACVDLPDPCGVGARLFRSAPGGGDLRPDHGDLLLGEDGQSAGGAERFGYPQGYRGGAPPGGGADLHLRGLVPALSPQPRFQHRVALYPLRPSGGDRGGPAGEHSDRRRL